MAINHGVTDHPLPLLLDIPQIAALLGSGESTVRKWASGAKRPPQGFPAFIRLGGRVVMKRADLEDWVANLGKEGQAAIREELPETKRRRGRPRKVDQSRDRLWRSGVEE